MKKEILYPVITAVIVGAVAFYGGMHYQQSKRAAFFADGKGNFNFQGQGGRMMGGNGGGQGRGGMMGSRPTVGEVISSDDKSITVKLDDGSTKIVLVSESTTINKTDPGSKADLKEGTKVAVFGTDNNGTVTAQSIQLNPQIRTFQSSPSATPK